MVSPDGASQHHHKPAARWSCPSRPLLQQSSVINPVVQLWIDSSPRSMAGASRHHPLHGGMAADLHRAPASVRFDALML